MVVADERRFHGVHELAEVGLIGGNGIALSPQLLVVRVSGKQIDVGQVHRIAFPQMRHQPAQGREITGARFVRDEVIIQRRMLTNAVDQGIEFLTLRRVFERGGRQQRILQLGSQTMAVDKIQVLFAAPDQIPSTIGHLLGNSLGHGRSSPISHDGRAHLPPSVTCQVRGPPG